MAGPVQGTTPQESRLPTDLAYAYNVRSTYRPREEPRDFGSIEVRTKLFTPAVNGFGPRTIERGPNLNPTGGTVAPGAVRPVLRGRGAR